MSDDFTALKSDVADHRDFQQSLRLLDRTAAWYRWNTIATLVLIVAAMAAVYQPKLAAWLHIPQELVIWIVPGLLALMLLSNGYAFYHQHHFKHIQKRLADQMQLNIKQSERAEKFSRLAIIDPLTGLFNRRFGEESLQKEITRAEENNLELAVIAMDLDYFKEVNDQHGHAAGDLVLKEFSRQLRKAIRACDLPIRIGGDEFLAVLPECTRENVHSILARLVPFEVTVNRQKIKVSYSRGKAHYQVGDTTKTIIQRADVALYAEKATRVTTPV